MRYRHSTARDLTAVEDALGGAHTFGYVDHALIRHTDRNGLSFRYDYDDAGRCIRTRGDGDLHDTVIEYHPERRLARATDAQGSPSPSSSTSSNG